MSAKQVNIIPNTSAWHEWRFKGLGASDVAALFGLSPYKTKRDLFMEKMGFGEPEDEDKSFIFQRGHDTEIEIRELFKAHTGIELNPACFENDFFKASLDGYDKVLGVLEAKFVGKEVLKKAATTNEIPKHHEIQVQAQLHTSESDKVYWGARAPKVKEGVVVEIGRNERLIKEIIREGEKFMEALDKGILPELTKGDVKFITSPEHIAMFEAFADLKRKKDEVEEKLKILEAQVKALADHPKVQCGDVKVVSYERSGSISYTTIPEIKALDKDYLDKFRAKPSIVKRIDFKKES